MEIKKNPLLIMENNRFPRLNQKYIFLILIINILQMTAWFIDTTMFPNYYTICN